MFKDVPFDISETTGVENEISLELLFHSIHTAQVTWIACKTQSLVEGLPVSIHLSFAQPVNQENKVPLKRSVRVTFTSQ